MTKHLNTTLQLSPMALPSLPSPRLSLALSTWVIIIIIIAGFLIDVGTRDETNETSGACLALKNTYLKTLKHTNETINYGMIQMSGGDMSMDFDQEKIFFKGNCIEYDVIDMF